VPKDIEIAVIDDDEAFQAALVDARFSPGIDPTDTPRQGSIMVQLAANRSIVSIRTFNCPDNCRELTAFDLIA
jgi:hypothetical protein